MLAISRRNSLRITAASTVVLFAPNLAVAQWGAAIKFLVEALASIGTALEITDRLEKWLHDQRCDVGISDLDALEYECEIVADSLSEQDIGAIPRLKAYLEKKDAQSWGRAKKAVGRLLNDSGAFISALNAITAKLNEKTYPGPYEDLSKLRNALERIRASVTALASLPDKPGPETEELALTVIKQMDRLPSIARSAIDQLRMAQIERRKVKC